jgi:UDP-N-acetylmuramoyl-L-alanyl-D-glutamate--2,6-diaminopimelate ligase
MTHIAVTGTKGKTTVTRIVQHILMSEGNRVFGEYGNDGSFIDGKRDFNFRPADAYFSRSEVKESDYVVSEATSYVLGLDVYDNLPIDVGVFTGFEELEHTELYSSPLEYLETKKRIFTYLNKEAIVFVNRDSEKYDQITKGQESKFISFGENEDSDAVISEISVSMGNTTFKLADLENNVHEITSSLYGIFNVSNITAAFLVCQKVGLSIEAIIQGIASFPGIKGRSNVYHIVDTNSIVVIDYAHTPESLRYQLEFLRENKGTRKLVTIFGCGGEKSTEKRPLMGEISAELSDYTVLTNDNPRGEQPRQIIYDIIKGMDNLHSLEVIPDRDEAIRSTLSSFHNSLILIAGKGNESETSIAGIAIPSNDFEIVNTWIVQNGYSVRGYFDYLD